jgi:hypothetical protein
MSLVSHLGATAGITSALVGVSDMDTSGLDPQAGRDQDGRDGYRWFRPRMLHQRPELTSWGREQLRRNVIPAEHRASFIAELRRHFRAATPSTATEVA